MILLWTPLPIIILFISYYLFSLPNISKTKWAKLGRSISIILAIATLLYWINGYNDKGSTGKRKVDAIVITQFTQHIRDLIVAGKIEEAKEAIAKFNERYPAIAGDDETVKAYIKKLIQETK
jgi:hypothetical protein